jgi:hypothetical protein
MFKFTQRILINVFANKSRAFLLNVYFWAMSLFVIFNLISAYVIPINLGIMCVIIGIIVKLISRYPHDEPNPSKSASPIGVKLVLLLIIILVWLSWYTFPY